MLAARLGVNYPLRMTPNRMLAQWREKQGLSLREAGKMLNVSGSAIERIEIGGMPSVQTANIIERVTKGPWQVKAKDWGEPSVREQVKP